MKDSRVKYIIFILLAMFSLLGCRSQKSLSNSSDDSKVLVIGSDRYEPYIYRNEDGDFEGIDVELATEALRRMGYKPEFKPIVWENKKDYLADGAVDCLWGCFSMNGREEEYQWAGPYLYSRQMAAVRMDSDILKISDLDGRRVAVQETSKAEEYFLYSDSRSVPDVESVYCFSRMDEVYAALRKNYVEAVCGHEGALRLFIDTAPDEYRLLEGSLFLSRLGVAFGKEYDKEFVAELERVLGEMLSDGTTAEIVRKYGLDVDKSLDKGEN